MVDQLSRCLTISIGRGKIIVEFFSAATLFSVCRYLNWSAAGDWAITSAASCSDRDASFSPSAAITFARASLVASASAAIALCSCTGSRTSLLSTRSTLIPQLSVASSRTACMEMASESLSWRISARLLVPSMFRNVVWASNL
ncbi:hypothetical protein PMAYCL1PPCAC_02360, partial [Pristionchus mayeri]